MSSMKRWLTRGVAVLVIVAGILVAWSYVEPASAYPGYSCNPGPGHGDPGCHVPVTAPPTTSAPAPTSPPPAPVTTKRASSTPKSTAAPTTDTEVAAESTTTTDSTGMVAGTTDGGGTGSTGAWIALSSGLGVVALASWIAMTIMWVRKRRATAVQGLPAAGPVRFVRPERFAHWIYALCFLAAGLTGAIMWIPWTREWLAGARYGLSQYHGYVGLAMVGIPLLIFLVFAPLRLGRNVRELSQWEDHDGRWLRAALAGRMFRGKTMPPQRRFNAGQKVNSHLVAGLALGFLLTGIPLLFFMGEMPAWLRPGILFAHQVLAVTSAVLLLGHLAMALLTKHGRAGLAAMIKGIMPAGAAREGHSLWYAEWLRQRSEQESGSRV